ncbi:MAG: DegT/DnrJ/EryC1/StrS family aminotransferase [Fibrobacteres bacterium]|nr:DegT/DnrJ/EryC1/StrS family aminotransferase [Fibrobacterota bacterium]
MKNSEKLAIEGGKPVRTKPFPHVYPGAAVYGAEEIKEALDVIKAQSPFRFYGKAVPGKTDAFEKLFAEKTGTKYALGVSSGTSALKVALAAIGVGPGDEVIIPAATFIASAGAVVMARAVPVLCEVDESLNMDPKDIERRITPRTKAIMPVHLMGVAANMKEIMKVARKHKLLVIEDCAQASGCSFGGKMVGSFGDIAAFSLQHNKLITSGEGGVVTTNSKKLFERAIRAHDHGQVRSTHAAFVDASDEFSFLAENYRMSEICGSLALAQLRKRDAIVNAQIKFKKELKVKLAALKSDVFTFRKATDIKGDISVACFLTFKTAEMTKKFMAAMGKEGVCFSQLYGGKGVHGWSQLREKKTVTSEGCPFKCPLYKGKPDYSIGSMPKTEDLLSRSTMIQITPDWTMKEVDDVVTATRKVLSWLNA